MLVKNVLALLVAGLAVATATNSSNDTATTTASSSGSSNATTQAASSSGNSSTTTAAPSPNPSTAAATVPSGGGATAGPTTQASSGTGGAGPTTQASSGTTGGGSSATSAAPSGTTGGDDKNATDAPSVADPVPVKVVKFAIKGVKVSCPGGTCDDSSCKTVQNSQSMITGAKKVACSGMVQSGEDINKVCSIKIDCTLGSRLRQLSGNGTSTKKLNLDFNVRIQQDKAKTLTEINTELKTLTETKNSKNPFVEKLLAEPIAFSGNALVAEVDQAITVPIAEESLVTTVTGKGFHLHYYAADTACGGTPEDIKGTTGDACATAASSAVHSAKVPSCTPDFVNSVHIYTDALCTVSKKTTVSVMDRVCYAYGSDSMELDCSESVMAASTSDASSKSLVGVAFGLIMGFTTLM